MIYDLTLPLDHNILTFPGDPHFKRARVLSIDRGDRINLSLLTFGAHTGTHIDSPVHMIDGGADVSRVLARTLIGPARVVNIANPMAVTVEELQSKSIERCHRILLRTRNSLSWKTQTFSSDYVYIDEKAADYLSRIGLQLVGFDFLSIEKFGLEGFPAHKALMKNDTVIVEGLNLYDVPEGNYILFCGALPIIGSDGAPARVFLIDRDEVASFGGR